MKKEVIKNNTTKKEKLNTDQQLSKKEREEQIKIFDDWIIEQEDEAIKECLDRIVEKPYKILNQDLLPDTNNCSRNTNYLMTVKTPSGIKDYGVTVKVKGSSWYCISDEDKKEEE